MAAPLPLFFSWRSHTQEILLIRRFGFHGFAKTLDGFVRADRKNHRPPR